MELYNEHQTPNHISTHLLSTFLLTLVLEINFSIKLHIIHISGKRMIAQGTDGISRGYFLEGVMSGRDMLDYIPLNKSGINRYPKLLSWIQQWTDKGDLEPLVESEWLWKGQGLSDTFYTNVDKFELPMKTQEDVFLWAPPPAIADVALEYIHKSVHKRPTNYHILIIPKIMTYTWRKHVLKTCDLSFYIDIQHGS